MSKDMVEESRLGSICFQCIGFTLAPAPSLFLCDLNVLIFVVVVRYDIAVERLATPARIK